ncbi:hypothetical protein BO83DRAFT_432322 [Aspergillus eucalypticola CBS 122712]|uniref:Rhodopsin domain-containing protein n=1 Tax=Aspergillus eucalypticola (strain CBS 122712 / IBT 29274) TaxID=1448314 RepID=A0A317UKW2_ASPEC|nr:uncharacterized protein BO83DRAFT_432322 [Aspergillus eucalypticola CBS 122712]PWY62634.1 hypothetical protein BO83DRAFT_432322 [Aspergillus eucalypticola CBS 122712]
MPLEDGHYYNGGPPPGETYDFDYSHRHLYTANMEVISAGLIISTMSIILAWVFSLGTQACAIYGYKHGGMGIHFWNVTPAVYDVYVKVCSSRIIQPKLMYLGRSLRSNHLRSALAFAKISLIILYYRNLCQKRYQQWILYGIAFIVSSYSFALGLAFIFGCHPIQKGWDISVTGTYVNQYALYVATAVLNIISDIALILVPIPTVLGLNMPGLQKFRPFADVYGWLRNSRNRHHPSNHFDPLSHSSDPTYNIGRPDLWINIEANFAIICSCLPFLRYFLRRYAPRLIGENSSLARRYHSYTYHYTGGSRARRKEGLTQPQDDIELAENGGSINAPCSDVDGSAI